MRSALVILTPGFPADESDSTCLPPQQTFVRTLQALFPDRQLLVLTFVYPFSSGSYEWNNVKVISFGRPGAGRLHRKLTYLRVWRTLLGLRKEYRIQGLLAFWLGPCAWLGARFARRFRFPFRCWLLGQDARAGNKYFRKIKPLPEELIALSDAVARGFEKSYGIRPASVVPPGVDPAMFAAPTHERDIDVLGVGSLIPLKQFDQFIDVIAALRSRFPFLRATICGDGTLRAGLEKQASRNGLPPAALVFTGRLPHEEVLKLMQRSRVLLHTSSYEGFGVVQLEALYAGAQVVGFVKPMDENISGWTTVTTTTEMIMTVTRLLEMQDPVIENRLPFRLEDSARLMNQFFDSSSARIPLTGSKAASASSVLLKEPGSKPAAIS